MSILERIISVVSPEWAVNRASARATLQQIDSFLGTNSGYASGKIDRLNGGKRVQHLKENQIAPDNIQNAKSKAWQAWRDNPYARKIVRAIEAKVIGPAMVPESLATNPDGSPNTEFRKSCKTLWQSIEAGFDVRGMPGQGGQTMPGLQRLALRACVLSGNVLYRLVPIDPGEAMRRDIPVPLAIQLIDVARLSDDVPAGQVADGHMVHRGIEFDANGTRVAYWINDAAGTPVSHSASELRHLFVEDDIDQVLGVTWFAPSTLSMKDANDLQYNVIKSTAMAACVAMGIRKPSGKTRFGLQSSVENGAGTADGTDLTDVDGNAISRMSPGMIVNLGETGDLQSFSPNQPNINPEGFVQHMLRGVSAGMPGVKSSTIIGDYRQSSFSSEKSADNDIWPEVTALQDWFASGFCQPIYEAVVKAAVLSGYFGERFPVAEFNASPGRYLSAKWQGPVAQSINPEKDAGAAAARMQHGLSSPQMECARINVNWIDVLNDVADFYSTAASKGIPEEVVNNIFSVDTQDVTEALPASPDPMPAPKPTTPKKKAASAKAK
mgnify:CR=1 FL=1